MEMKKDDEKVKRLAAKKEENCTANDGKRVGGTSLAHSN